MQTQRTILWVIFSMSLLFLWDNWQRHLGKPSLFFPTPTAQAPQGAGKGGTTPPPGASARDVPTAAALPGPGSTAAAPGQAATPAGERITITTDVLRLDFDTTGAQIVRAELLQHADAEGAQRMVLLEQTEQRTYLAQSGLVGSADAAQPYPTHRTPFKLVSGDRALRGEQLQLRFEAESGGVKLAKVFTFKRGSYDIDVRHELTNTGSAPATPTLYMQLLRDAGKPPGESFFYATYTGPVVYSEQSKFQKVDFADIDKGKQDYVKKAPDGWVGLIQHYFVTAWIPKQATERENYVQRVDSLYRVGVKQPLGQIAPGATVQTDAKLYLGPQDQDALAKIAPGLDLVVDYGIFTIFAKPLFWLLQWLHNLVGNWGWAIILLTFIVKAAFFPLMTASYKSMARMKAVTPRMKQLQERYKDDRQKMNMALMELYKTEKINPFGSCLPILVTIPVFIALYWVLLASVEMRGAPWLGWVQDLSRPDPYYILPILMGVTMFIQLKLNPTPPDPMQARMMWIMQTVFSVMFLFFPAGLNLYYVVNNVLSILQQWFINKRLEKAGLKT
jgi:YidC/Oxa1 family membrane protein insertase